MERKKGEKNEVLAEMGRTERAIETEDREVKKLGERLKALYDTFEKTIEPKDEKTARDPKYAKYMRFLAMVHTHIISAFDVDENRGNELTGGGTDSRASVQTDTTSDPDIEK